MLAFPGMIAGAAKEAGIKIPESPDENFDPNEFPHFFVFCKMQLERRMTGPNEHWENAKVIAAVSEEEIKTITPSQLIERGFVIIL